MGRVPEWDEIWGWHLFVKGSFNGKYWCALCDCPKDDHVPLPEGKVELPKTTKAGEKYVGCQ